MAYDHPKDAFIVEASPFWQILYSPSKKEFYVQSSDSDPPPMTLTRGTLEHLQNVLDNWTPALQKKILADLKAWDEELKRRGHSGLGMGWFTEQTMAEHGNRDFFKGVKLTIRAPRPDETD